MTVDRASSPGVAGPRVSIVMATYNREGTIGRAIESVLAQDMTDWELIIVDDGSTDGTQTALRSYLEDERLRLITQPLNSGAAAAWNAALDVLTGEWFTLLGSDDEMLPGALTTLLGVPDAIDPAIDAVTCNGIDSQSGALTGSGLESDQYLDLATEVARSTGDHWGITKTSLLEGLRFPEDLRSSPGVLFLQISERARRYYIHRPLLLVHREGSDRITAPDAMVDVHRRLRFYSALRRQTRYLDIVRRHRPNGYAQLLFNMALASLLQGDRRTAASDLLDLRRYGSAPQVGFVGVCLLSGRRGTSALLATALHARNLLRKLPAFRKA